MTIFNKSEEEKELLKECFEKFGNLTKIEIEKLKNYDEDPDLIEDFFGFLKRSLKYAPEVILSS